MHDKKEIAEAMADKIKSISYDDVYHYPGKIAVETYTAGAIFIEPGDVCQYFYFIKKGIVRTYYVSGKNELEKTIFIRLEGDHFGDYYALIRNLESRLYFECLEDCIFYRFELSELQPYVYSNERMLSAAFDFMMNLIAEYIIRQEDFIFFTAEERYIKFSKEYPEIISRVPAKYISSLLGITPVSLSRIKKRIQRRSEK